MIGTVGPKPASSADAKAVQELNTQLADAKKQLETIAAERAAAPKVSRRGRTKVDAS